MPKIPQTQVAVDGITKMPGNAMIAYVDWAMLKHEFIINRDCPRPRTWLKRVKGWSNQRCVSGNTNEHIAGWGEDRAAFQQKIAQNAMDQVMQEERDLLPKLRRAKLTLVLQAIKAAGTFNRLEPAEQRTVYQIIKTELGEPMSIKLEGQIQFGKDPVEALLEDFGLMKDGAILPVIQEGEVIDADQTDSAEAEAVSSGSPAEVPQG